MHFRFQAERERKPEDHVYYNTRNSIPVAVVSPTVTSQHIEDEPRYFINDDVTVEEGDHYYATLTTPPTHDVYAVPNRSRNVRQISDNDVIVVDNDVYTEDHGVLRPRSIDDVTMVDNVIYNENDDDASGHVESDNEKHTYYNTDCL